jgi:glycosyltransferase involved in cell wall biosynthesis
VEHSIRANAHVNGKPALDTILNGVDVSYLSGIDADTRGVKAELGIPQDHFLVIHVGNFTPKKRHEDLLQGAKLVLGQRPKVSFMLVGTGPLEQAMKDRARELGIQSNIVFTGLRTDVPRLMAASDMFVLPSQFEGLPISLLEAICVGKPVIASRVGGVAEVVEDNVDGLLIEPLRPDMLAEKILSLLSKPELGQGLVENGRRRVKEQFSIERMVHDMESLYDKVLVEKEVAR